MTTNYGARPGLEEDSAARADCQRCRDAAAAVKARGFRLSAGAWHSADRCYAFSVEGCGPATYGHSRYSRMEYADPEMRRLQAIEDGREAVSRSREAGAALIAQSKGGRP